MLKLFNATNEPTYTSSKKLKKIQPEPLPTPLAEVESSSQWTENSDDEFESLHNVLFSQATTRHQATSPPKNPCEKIPH